MKIQIIHGDQEDTLNRSAQYLIAELQALHERAGLQEQRIATKVNFFLAIVTAVIGGIVFIFNQNFRAMKITYAYLILVAVLLIFAFLLTLGWFIYLQSLDAHYSESFFYRRIGRIRRWFLDHDLSLALYTPFTVGDDTPTFDESPSLGMRGIETVLLVVNSAISALIAGIFAFVFILDPMIEKKFLFDWIPFVLTIPFLLLGFFLNFTVQIWKAKSFLHDREKSESKNGRIHFPKDMHIKQKAEIFSDKEKAKQN